MKYNHLVILAFLSACAHQQIPQETADNREIQGRINTANEVHDSESAAKYPQMELSSQMLYQFLLSDIAAQRGQPQWAAEGYLDLARKTRDLRVVKRAAQLAYESRQMELTLEAFKLWNELDSRAPMPKQMLATILMSSGQLDKAKPLLVELLAYDAANADKQIMQMYPLLARAANKADVYRLLKDITQPYGKFAEIHWVLAQAANATGNGEEAMREAREARRIHPDWDLAVLLEAELIRPKYSPQALEMTGKFLESHPGAEEVRKYYARALLEQKRYKESREQYQVLLEKQPGNTEIAFAIALLSIQMGELDRAEAELKQTLAAGRKDSATVHYYLAQLHEAKKNNAAALQEYQQVTEGEYYVQARLRTAYLLGKANKLAEAREILQKTNAHTNQQKVLLILTEAQLLRDAQKLEQAFKVLGKGLDKYANDPDLLYEAGMIADRMGKFDVSEKMLRQLIKVSPDHAHAYNALGYSLMERKVRLSEAMILVEKAHQLEPDDAAIMDSLGWGYFLTGETKKSLDFLRRAYAAYPDAEIAAHLGEVLWQSGAQDEARTVWQQAQQNHPENKVLQAVIKKFVP